MTFEDWWKHVNEFWEQNGIDRNDLERVALCRAAWDAAVKRCAESLELLAANCRRAADGEEEWSSFNAANQQAATLESAAKLLREGKP
jgi:hypothetical protein